MRPRGVENEFLTRLVVVGVTITFARFQLLLADLQLDVGGRRVGRALLGRASWRHNLIFVNLNLQLHRYVDQPVLRYGDLDRTWLLQRLLLVAAAILVPVLVVLLLLVAFLLLVPLLLLVVMAFLLGDVNLAVAAAGAADWRRAEYRMTLGRCFRLCRRWGRQQRRG